MEKTDPWSGLPVPAEQSQAGARRVNASGRWDLFWARDTDRKRLLILRFKAPYRPDDLPKMRGLEVSIQTQENGSALILKLLDDTLHPVFHRLCLDVVEAAEEASSEAAAVAAAVSQTWSWHYLLRGAARERLSLEEQRGLIGELYVLRSLLLDVLEPGRALNAWKGPLGGVHDFDLPGGLIEAKAHGSRSATVEISSAEQLEPPSGRRLYLHTLEVVHVSEEEEGSTSLATLVGQIGDSLLQTDPAVIDRYFSLIRAAGIRRLEDYTKDFWLWRSSQLYEVVSGFPAIRRSALPQAIKGVKYALDLAPCGQFLIAAGRLGQEMKEIANVE